MPDATLDATPPLLRRLGLIIGPLAALLVYFLLPSHYQSSTGELIDLTHAARATLALLAWMAAWWFTEAIDISATALLPVVFFPLAGVMSAKAAAAPYADDTIFLFGGGFTLALAMQRWHFDQRIALFTIRFFGTRPANMVLGCMIATALISAFVSNTATAAMMLPIGLSVVQLVQSRIAGSNRDNPAENGRNFAVCVMLGIAYAASIGGLSTIISTPPNAFAAAFIREQFPGREISFLTWAMFGVPLVAVFLPLAWFVLVRFVHPVRMNRVEGGSDFLANAYRELGPMTPGERGVAIVFIITAALWMTRPLLAPLTILGAQPFAPVRDSTIAILAALALFIIPVRARRNDAGAREWSRLIDWPTAAKMPWGVLVLFGGGLSLAHAIESHGVAEFLGHQATALPILAPVILIALVVAAVVFFSEFASNTATAATLIPILAAIAPALGVSDPILLVLPAALAASAAFMMPAGTPPNAIVFGSGHVTLPQMIKAGFWLNLLSITLITILTFTIIKPLISNSSP